MYRSVSKENIVPASNKSEITPLARSISLDRINNAPKTNDANNKTKSKIE